jgi:uncharacterized membrane protein YhaH (DUF805 family)
VSLTELFSGFNGRIGRQTYWLAALALAFVGISALLALTAIATGDPFSPDVWEMRPAAVSVWLPIFGGYYAVIFWPALAIAIKRWHDRNRPAWIYLILAFVSLAPFLVRIAQARNLLQDSSSQYAGIITGTALLLMIYPMIELGFLKGTAGPNRYGADPLPPEAHVTGKGFLNWMFGLNGRIGRSRWWLGLLVAAGVVFGGLTLMGMVFSAVVSIRVPGLMQDPAFEQRIEDPQWIHSPEAAAFITAAVVVMLAVMLPALLIAWWNTVAITVKRLHDQGLSGWLAAPPFLALAAAIAGSIFLQEDGDSSITGAALWLLCALIWLWTVLQLGMLRGQSGTNKYGDDPLQ